MEGTAIDFQLDTGAVESVISEEDFLEKPELASLALMKTQRQFRTQNPSSRLFLTRRYILRRRRGLLRPLQGQSRPDSDLGSPRGLRRRVRGQS